ncbi:Hypothetical predicted protein [Mytilus galloprovincialis]|uniref:Uncharacterized protein n=1 Tax=Mytilus galloprovincialis TaxID=29158 RepID=A0A8B6C5F0_MYTGA|nr:Hypothetical predicted protein [Mytilus galloprovincialis]
MSFKNSNNTISKYKSTQSPTQSQDFDTVKRHTSQRSIGTQTQTQIRSTQTCNNHAEEIPENILLEAYSYKLQLRRDYLHSLLLDHEEIILFDLVKKSYTPDTRQCIINITNFNVSSNNVGPVIEEVNRTPNAVPTRKTVDNIMKLLLVKNNLD